MRNVYLGIDTSNYTTSTAVLHERDKSVVQQKKLLPVKQGELGLRQSDAVFHHTQQIPDLLDALWSDDYVPKAVGVSVKPRDAEGSYMPCFSVGALQESLQKHMVSRCTRFLIKADILGLHYMVQDVWICCLILSLHFMCQAEPQKLCWFVLIKSVSLRRKSFLVHWI